MAKGYYGNAEAVVFNQAPFFNFFQQQQQRKKLEQQMVDKQIGDDLAKLSPEGMRPQDVDGFLQEYQALKDLSINYRDAIRNPARNPGAWREYQTRKASLMGRIAKSKGAKEGKKGLIDFYNKNYDKIDLPSFSGALAKYDSPIGTAEFEEMSNFDPTDVLFKAPKMDLVKLFAPINAIKPEESQQVRVLPNGQVEKVRTKQVNPGVIANYMSNAYNSDTLNAKKYFDDTFNTLDPSEKMELENYAKKMLDPDFQIETPEDLAIASGIYQRTNQNVIRDLQGADLDRREAFQRAQQQRGFNFRRQMVNEAEDRKKKDDFLWETEVESALKAGDTENVRRLASRLDASTPGVEHVFLKEGVSKAFALRRFKRAVAEDGVDSKTKYLTPQDFKEGVLVVAVPKVDKEGVRIKDRYGKDAYDVMAVSARDPYLKNRLNKIKTYAEGGRIKGLPDDIYQQDQSGVMPFVAPGSFNGDIYDDEENEEQ